VRNFASACNAKVRFMILEPRNACPCAPTSQPPRTGQSLVAQCQPIKARQVLLAQQKGN
jgi:hypothetical protein